MQDDIESLPDLAAKAFPEAVASPTAEAPHGPRKHGRPKGCRRQATGGHADLHHRESAG